MIQELLAERKTSIPSFACSSPSLNSPNCPPPTTTTTPPILTPTSNNATSSTTPKPANSNGPGGGPESASGGQQQQNLRCPRCDSTNTKFCYYNNYNLTQPRHFCKTCRRYWTKGGTLRNVPIGGGCRKNKTTLTGVSGSTTSGISLMSKSSSSTNAAAMAKLAKASLSTEMLLNGAGPGFGLLDHLGPHPYSDLQLGSNLTPPLWASIPQGQSSSHILALLRGATPFTNPNPNPNSNPSSTQASSVSVFNPVKTEGGDANLGLDPYGNGAPSILGSFLRGNHHQVNGFGLGASPDDMQNGGNNGSNILELYHRLKSSSNYGYCGDEIPGSLMLGNMMGSSSSSSPSPSAMSSPFLEASNAGENLGGYNSFMSSPGISGWSEFPTVPINGAFP